MVDDSAGVDVGFQEVIQRSSLLLSLADFCSNASHNAVRSGVSLVLAT